MQERTMRRKDRQISEEESLDVLRRAEYGVLCTTDGTGLAYGVPLSYALREGTIYFHCARLGRKIDNIRRNPQVSFVVVGETQPVYDDNFSTYFESVMVFGAAREVTDDAEKYTALQALAEKYLPEHMDKADHDIKHSWKRTAVYAVSLDHITGKAKRRKAAAAAPPA